MKRLLIIPLLFPFLSFAQDTTAIPDKIEKPVYTRSEVRDISDSIMRSFTGDLFEYCTYTKKGYYKYTDSGSKRMHWMMLNKHKKLKKTMVNVYMSYDLDYPYPSCIAYDRIHGTIYMTLDSELHLVGKPDMQFIPDFVWGKEDCHLMTKEEAITTALKFGFKEGSTPETKIEYDIRSKQFYWYVTNSVQQDSLIQRHTIEQTIQLNARTRGKVSFSKTEKGPKVQH